MISIEESLANVEHKQHAQANKSDVLTSSFDEKTVSESGGKDEDKTLLLSRELAVKLNPEKADFNGALILYGLYLWQIQKIRPFEYTPMVDGKRGCYQSLSELQTQYPWLTEEGIRVSLWRCAETLGKNFIVDAKNPGAIRGKFHFYLSPLLIKKYGFNQGKACPMSTAKGLIGISKLDAAKYGVLEAVLLHNLQYVTQEEVNTDPLVDDQGRIYRELSPTTLTAVKENKDGMEKPILPVSRKAVSAALSALKNAGAIEEHPQRTSFYRVVLASEVPFLSVTKVADAVTKVASRVTRVARQSVGSDRKPLTSLDLQPFVETSDSNADRNSDRKCIFPSTVSLCSTGNGEPSELSAGAKRLAKIINQSLEASRQKSPTPVSLEDLESYKCYDLLDYDKAHFVGYEFIYDFVTLEAYSGKPYSRKAELDEFMEQTTLMYAMSGLSYTKQDHCKVREMFVKHPTLTPEDISELLRHHPRPLLEYVRSPRSGHDWWFWARRIKTVKQWLRYLPQLIREYCRFFLCEQWDTFEDEETGRTIFKYSELRRPLLDIAFGLESRIPVTHKSEANEDGDFNLRPVYYPEFVGLPTIQHVTQDRNPMMEAA